MSPRGDTRIPLLAAGPFGAILGILGGLLAYGFASAPGATPDFIYAWRGAQLLLEGENPYAVLRGGAYPYPSPLFYPLPTLLVTIPVARLPLPVASGVMFGMMTAALAWALDRAGRERAAPFLGGSFLIAAGLGQWSPLVTAAGLRARWGWLAILKPNIGLPVLLAQPSRSALVGAALVFGGSLLVLPTWPVDWLRGSLGWTGNPPHPVPIVTGAGPILLLALLRWRRSEARLLLLMSLVPQTFFFADQLPLWLVPRSRKEVLALSGLSLAAVAYAYVGYRAGTATNLVYACQPLVVPVLYLPCLVMVLRRPNVAEGSSGLDRPPTQLASSALHEAPPERMA